MVLICCSHRRYLNYELGFIQASFQRLNGVCLRLSHILTNHGGRSGFAKMAWMGGERFVPPLSLGGWLNMFQDYTFDNWEGRFSQHEQCEIEGLVERCPVATWIRIDWVDVWRIGDIPTSTESMYWPSNANWNISISLGPSLGQPPSELLAQADFSWHKTVKLVCKELDTLEPEFEFRYLTGNQLVVRQWQIGAAVRTTWIWYTACIKRAPPIRFLATGRVTLSLGLWSSKAFANKSSHSWPAAVPRSCRPGFFFGKKHALIMPSSSTPLQLNLSMSQVSTTVLLQLVLLK